MSQPLTLRTETGDEHLDLEEFEVRTRKGEVSPQSLVRFPAVTGDAFVPACELEIFKVLHEPRRAYFARAFRLSQFPWVTAALIFVNLAAYLWTVRQGPIDLNAMVRYGGKVGPLITDLAETWRLITANFLHHDGLHIGLNLFVLFNVGGVLENAYRRLDFLWLLALSGVATMGVSLALSDAASLGASGMVYGCLGGVVVFGLKYRSILPPRYRRVMAEAAIPTVLGLFLIGLRSERTDNWAHLGGLVAGLLGSLPLKPQLLVERASAWPASMRALPPLLLAGLTLFGQPLWGRLLPVFRVEHDDAFGISVPVPRDWRAGGANQLGQVAYYNGLPELGRATFAANVIETDDPDQLAEQARRFVEEGLSREALGPEVRQVMPRAPEAVKVAGEKALLVRAFLEESDGDNELRAYFVPRGGQVYQLVFSYPAELPRYGRVIDQMVSGIQFHEPQALRQARSRALLFPNAPWSLGLLGETLLRQGEPLEAAEALRAAVSREPSNVELRAELALALLQGGKLEEGCSAAKDAVLYAPDNPSVIAVDARCELFRGNGQQALGRIRDARKLSPGDERLRQLELRLRAALRNTPIEKSR